MIERFPRPHVVPRYPRASEVIADILRVRILNGDIEEGEHLPTQETLLEEFRVSKPTLREALRTLENEGLITVQRGNVGGSTVRWPTSDEAAYTLALILRLRGADLMDLHTALQTLEPICAALCAGRDDRATEVLPALRAVHERSMAELDDPVRLARASTEFHGQLVQLSGNTTISLVVGALQFLWQAHASAWLAEESRTRRGGLPDQDERSHGMAAHQTLIDLIEAGDVEATFRQAREHVDEYFPMFGRQMDQQIDFGVVNWFRQR